MIVDLKGYRELMINISALFDQASGSRSVPNWRNGIMVACAAVALFAGYCFAHSWLELSRPSPAASVRWGLIAGAPMGGMAWLLWAYRKPIAAYAWRGTGPAALFLGSVLVVLLIGGSVLHLVAGQASPDSLAASLVQSAFDLLPLGLAVVVALGASLIAVCRAAPRQPQFFSNLSAQWLAIPEEPTLRLRQADVTAVRAAGNYCEIQASSRVHLIRAPMKTMATQLADQGFVRVHRSVLINLERLRSVECDGGILVAHLDDESRVPVGRAFRAGLESALSARSSLQSDIRP